MSLTLTALIEYTLPNVATIKDIMSTLRADSSQETDDWIQVSLCSWVLYLHVVNNGKLVNLPK